MVFNPCRSKDFLPTKSLQGSEIGLVESANLLGLSITSNLSWDNNTKLIIKKCYEKLWIMKRLKNLGARRSDLLEVYVKQIRCHAEYAVPVWNASLTGLNAAKIERIQKSALYIILGEEYGSYSRALRTLNLEKLSVRREQLCLKFALKCEKSPKFSQWFKPNIKLRQTRLKPLKYCEVHSKTQRFYRSPIAYFIRLLNQHYMKS